MVQVWAGTLAGLLVCIVVGAGIIGAFYSLQKRNLWSKSEDLYEGIFSLLAAIVITFVGAMILRIGKMQESWRKKLAAEGEKGFRATSKKYAMFILPLVTVLREGIEAIVFVGGIGVSEPPSAFPLPVISALVAGSLVGYFVYRGGLTVAVKWFLIASTVVLYLVAAGLLSKAAWSFDMYEVRDRTSGLPTSHADPSKVRKSRRWRRSRDRCRARQLQHPPQRLARQLLLPRGQRRRRLGRILCQYVSPFPHHCPLIFTLLTGFMLPLVLGWQNSATYGSVLCYNLYWVVVSACFVAMRYKECNGRYPFMKARPAAPEPASPHSGIVSPNRSDAAEKVDVTVAEAAEIK